MLALLGFSGTTTNLPSPRATPPDPRFEQFKGVCRSYGLAYRNPGFNPEDRIAVFGQPNTPANLVQTRFFGQSVTVHQKVAPCLEAVERDLRDEGTTYRVRKVSSYRAEREDRLYWYHPYGAAIDINPDTNPQCLRNGSGVDPLKRCSLDKPYDIPREWVETFERYGFYWGGNFGTTPDYMHFEWHGEKP